MNDNDNLTVAQKMLVSKAIANCRRSNQYASVSDGTGEGYAYPCANGVSWGFNDGETGCCIAQGVVRGKD